MCNRGIYRRTLYGYGSVLPKTTPDAGTEKTPCLWATSVAAKKDPMEVFFFIFNSTKMQDVVAFVKFGKVENFELGNNLV
mgnify:FL=1